MSTRKKMSNPSNAPLDKIRIVAEGHAVCRSAYCRAFTGINLQTGKEYDLNCRSHRCEKHNRQWCNRWGACIGDTLPNYSTLLLVNLTTATLEPHKIIKDALEIFIKSFRDTFGETEYVKVAEFNRRQTQGHFHFVLGSNEWSIPPMPANYDKKLSWPSKLFEFIKIEWYAALKAAGSERPAHVVWVQPPLNPEGSARYAVGYITSESKQAEKLPDSYKGRKITYSKRFFKKSPTAIWADLLEKWFGVRIKPISGLRYSHELYEWLAAHSPIGPSVETRFKLELTATWQLDPKLAIQAWERRHFFTTAKDDPLSMLDEARNSD